MKKKNSGAKSSFVKTAKNNSSIIILIVIGFLAISAINFFNIATSQTIATFSLDEFEIGQIADRTIFANRDIPADIENPVSIEAGEKVIRKGFPISEDGYAKLRKMAASPQYLDFRSFANSELYLFLLACVWFLLFAYLPFDHKIQLREIILQLVLFLIVYGLAIFASKTVWFSHPFSLPMVIPASLCVLLIAILYGQLPAILFSAILSFGVFNAVSWEIVPFLHTLSSCIAATTVVRKIERRIDMVFASLILAILDFAFLLLLAVIFNENIAIIARSLVGVAFNGFISGILTLGLLTPLELILNSASVFRLMDLSDLNNPVMRKLMISASGTYTHSLMVAQLAESACREIGANSLLARVGAYYHDIGKMEQSEYFVENQTGTNKHEDLNPALSVTVIKNHVRKGVEKARQLHLPEQVISIIAEHHGNSVISYFYNEAKEKDPNVSEEDFRYTGTPPVTRESGVVMLADTVEAACHTLENPTSSRLEKFIQTLFDSKAEHKQLDNCGLTFRDLAKVKESFVQLLTGYYHSRIEYPNQKDPDKEDVKQVEDRQEKKSSQDKVQDKLEKNQDKKLESKKEEKKQVGSK